MGRIGTVRDKNGIIYHVFNGAHVECAGGDSCIFCRGNIGEKFTAWEESIPIRMPPEGKRYKNKLKQKNRGKTIAEICYTCKEIPCYICRRTKCEHWQKEAHRKGQEEGCAHWETGRCIEWSCDKGLITSMWR